MQDGIVVGAVGAYDWNGGVLKETRQGKVVPPKSSYADEFPEELKNHGAYLGELQPPALRTEAAGAGRQSVDKVQRGRCLCANRGNARPPFAAVQLTVGRVYIYTLLSYHEASALTLS